MSKFLSTYREIHDVVINHWIILQNFMKTHCNFLAREKLQICLKEAKETLILETSNLPRKLPKKKLPRKFSQRAPKIPQLTAAFLFVSLPFVLYHFVLFHLHSSILRYNLPPKKNRSVRVSKITCQ